MRPSRPSRFFDAGVPHERTAQAWERTAIAIIANGILLARYAATSAHWTIATIGLAETAAGAALLVWAGFHYNQLHGPIRAGTPIVHPTSTRLVGALTVSFIGASLTLALLLTILT